MDKFKIDNEYELKFNDQTGHWDTYHNDLLLGKSAKKLYKYYPLNINNIDALLNHYFYLSNPKDFNDPFDCNINLVENVDDLDKLQVVSRNTYKNIGICSFSETLDSHLMWAHYTNNYNGFVLGFDGENIEIKSKKEQVSRLTLTRVIYPLEPKTIKKEFPFAEHYIFTTKLKHWHYEKEWRLIVQLKNDDRTIEYFKRSVKQIYVGHKLIDRSKSAYRLLLQIFEINFPDTPVYVVYPHPKELKLTFEKVLN